MFCPLYNKEVDFDIFCTNCTFINFQTKECEYKEE